MPTKTRPKIRKNAIILFYEIDEKLIIIRIFSCSKRKVIGGDEDCERNPMNLPESNRAYGLTLNRA